MATRGLEPLGFTIVAGADLSGTQFAPLAMSGGKAVLCQKPSDVFIGISEQHPKINEHIGIIAGPARTKGRMGEAITKDDYLTVASGWFMKGTKCLWAGSSLSNIGSLSTHLVGIALETVASGAVGSMLMFQTWTKIDS